MKEDICDELVKKKKRKNKEKSEGQLDIAPLSWSAFLVKEREEQQSECL